MFVVKTSVVAKSVMAIAMTLTLSGLSACLGTGSDASIGALLGVKPSNAVTTEVVTTNNLPNLPYPPPGGPTSCIIGG
ncbi:MAG: hypothetical protein ACRC8Y_19055 [Chroococcales cyanobacterium]